MSGNNPNYCGHGCYSAAIIAGRSVREVDGKRLCVLCESRHRNGLVRYSPSNGTEFDYFQSRCEGCRHFTGDIDDVKKTACHWKVLDQMLNQMCEAKDSPKMWWNPDDIDPVTCPATCKRFTPKDYPHDDRDPPKPDVPGQMMLGEAIVIEEHVPQMAQH